MFRRYALVLLAVMAAAAPAAAQDVKPVQLTIGGGFTGVYGAASDRIGNGGNFTLGVLFNVNPVLGVQAEYAWNGVKQKQLSLPVFPQPLQGSGVPTDFFADTNMQYFDGNLHFNVPTSGKAQPFVITGRRLLPPSRSRRRPSAIRPSAIRTGTCATPRPCRSNRSSASGAPRTSG